MRCHRRQSVAAATVAVVSVAMAGVAGADRLTVACRGPGGGATGLVDAVNQANATVGPDTIDLAADCAYVLTAAASTTTAFQS